MIRLWNCDSIPMREIEFPKDTVVITDPPYGNGKYATDKAVPIEYYRWLVSSFKTVAIFGYPEKLIGICIGIGRQPDEWVTWNPVNKFMQLGKPLPKESECIAIFGKVVGGNRLFRERADNSFGKKLAIKRGLSPDVCKLGDVWRDYSPAIALSHKGRRHPNQKSLTVMMKLVVLCSDEGETIFDPFMGSGTTGEAVKVIGGRNFYGIEKDFDYFSVAENVISKAQQGSIRLLTPLALDGAIAPDNQQVLPADVLVGEGTLPEPPRQ